MHHCCGGLGVWDKELMKEATRGCQEESQEAGGPGWERGEVTGLSLEWPPVLVTASPTRHLTRSVFPAGNSGFAGGERNGRAWERERTK